MKLEYDVAVIGGGPAGAHTAMAVAKFSKGNARVLLIDRNVREEFGKKTKSGWACGDAVSKRSLEHVMNSLGIRYEWPEVEHQVDGVLVISPDHETEVLFDGEGYLLNRRLWPQKMLRHLERFGVEVMFGVDARSLIAEDGFVRGVRCTSRDGSILDVRAKVVVDASGSASVLRTNLPIEAKMEREIDKEHDMEGTGRYILEFERAVEDHTWFDPRYCIIHLDQFLAPGGYCWTFPKGENKVNIGLGVQKAALDRRNAAHGLRDNLASLIDQYVKANRAISNPSPPEGEADRGNVYSVWQVPVRRQNDCLVGNGFVVVGDAAWMPRPIDAGGIGPALYASVILGRTLAEAVESKDVSEAGLWSYNVNYVREYGYQMASFEVLRRYLQTLPNDDISFGMKHFLSQDDIESIKRREHPRFPLLTNFLRVLMDGELRRRVRERPKLARGLSYVANKSRRLISHYLDYPERPEGFGRWRVKLLRELREANERLGIA